jgi:hypothetical protein
MRTTTAATPTCPTTTPTTPGARIPRAARTGAALSIGVGAAAVAALLAPAGQSSAAATTFAAGATSSIQPATLATADRAALAERSASRSSRSGERGAATAAEASALDEGIPESLAAPELERAGTRYTTTALNVRLAPTEDAEVEKVLKPGAKVTITDIAQDGFQQIIVKDQPRWVKGEYLSKSKPKPRPAGLSGAPCASGSRVERGLRPNTIAVHRAVCNAFPSVTSYGGVRGGSANHGSGRAIDIMVTGSTGDAIASYVRANAAALGVTEVIWEQRIWTTQRASEGWRWMSDRGSATANHYDHVHVTTR